MSRFSLVAKKTNNFLGLSFNIMKDNVTNEYEVILRGTIIFRGSDLPKIKECINTYHINDWCGEYIGDKAVVQFVKEYNYYANTTN